MKLKHQDRCGRDAYVPALERTVKFGEVVTFDMSDDVQAIAAVGYAQQSRNWKPADKEARDLLASIAVDEGQTPTEPEPEEATE